MEEQYLNGLYTPDFLVGLCDDSDDDDQDNDNKENEEPDIKIDNKFRRCVKVFSCRVLKQFELPFGLMENFRMPCS